MNEGQARANILESLESGAASILDSSIELDKDELIAVAAAAQQGSKEDWTRLVNAVSRLVFRLAETYYMKWHTHLQPQASFDDVFLSGLESLNKATMKFDPSRGLAYTTPATWIIRNAVQRAVYAQIGVGHIPEKVLLKGVSPIDPFVNGLSLDHGGDGEKTREFHEVVAGPTEREVGDLERVRNIVEVLRLVDERLPMIAELASQDYALREIGRIVGIAGERVRQLLDAGAEAVTQAGLVECPARPDQPAPAARS